jgi:hypothetical protein
MDGAVRSHYSEARLPCPIQGIIPDSSFSMLQQMWGRELLQCDDGSGVFLNPVLVMYINRLQF